MICITSVLYWFQTSINCEDRNDKLPNEVIGGEKTWHSRFCEWSDTGEVNSAQVQRGDFWKENIRTSSGSAFRLRCRKSELQFVTKNHDQVWPEAHEVALKVAWGQRTLVVFSFETTVYHLPQTMPQVQVHSCSLLSCCSSTCCH